MWEVDYDAGSKGLDVYMWNGARTRTDLYTAANLILANSWYCGEVQANETSAGHGQVWLNGSSVASVNTDLSATNPISQVYLWNNGATGTVNMDDVQVANAYNGPIGAGAAPLPGPGVSLSPTSLTFASQTVSTTSGAQTVTLTNTGNAPLNITGISLNGTNPGDFAQTNTCPTGGSLAAGANCAISVTFTPTASGSRSAGVAIADNATGSPQTFALTGTGATATAPAVTLSPTSLAFGNQGVNSTSAGQAVTVTNSGTAALAISGITFTGTNPGDFAQTNTCPASPSTVAVGATCTVTVAFTPTASGNRAASLSVADNATGSPHTAALSGTGTLTTGTYLTDGFENGTALWAQAGNGSVTVESTVVNSGTHAAALTNASGQYIGLSASLAGGGQAQTYSRFCFNLAGLSGSTVLAQGRDVNGNNMWEVDYDSGRAGLDIYLWNGARVRTDLYTAVNVVLANTWYCGELQFNETSTGQAQVWLNGTSLATASGDFSATNPYGQLYLWNNGATGTVYFDDIQVSNAYNGPVGAA